MVIITERFAVRGEVDRARLSDRAGVYELFGRELIAAGDQRAWKIAPESVHVYSLPHDEIDDTRMQTRVCALWSPQSARLVGGEYDGDVVRVRREADGLPPQVLALPYRSSPYVDDNAAPRVTSNPSYSRKGIDPITDAWIYSLIP